MFVFGRNRLYLAEPLETSNIFSVSSVQADLFLGVSTAKCIPNTSIVVFSTTQNPKTAFVFDFGNAAADQKMEVDADIVSIDCSEDFIIVGTTRSTICFSRLLKHGNFSRLRELSGQSPFTAISPNGISAHIDGSNGQFSFLSMRENMTLSSWPLTISAIAISQKGTLAIGQVIASQIYLFNPTCTSKYDTLSANYGRLLNTISDDDRYLFFADSNPIKQIRHPLGVRPKGKRFAYGNRETKPFQSRYSIVAIDHTVDYFSLKPLPSLSLAHQFEEEPIFESSAVFVRVDGVQHLQYVTKSGRLVRFRENQTRSWNKM